MHIINANGLLIFICLFLVVERVSGRGSFSGRRKSRSLFTFNVGSSGGGIDSIGGIIPDAIQGIREPNKINQVDLIQAAAYLVQTATFCWISIRLSKELQKLFSGIMGVMGQSEKENKVSTDVFQSLKPNVTLSTYEIEMSSSIVFPKSIDTDFANLGGLDDVRMSLLEVAEDASPAYGVPKNLLKPVKAVLLYGPPGCGKTSLVQALCKRLNRPLLQITPSSLLRKYVGETSQLLRASFSLAAKIEPCVIFVDEMDSLFRSRRDGEHEFDRNLKTEFMQLWDTVAHSGDRVLIIGATNRPQDLDSAIQRRFERSYLVGPPDRASRAQIFRAVLKDAPTEAFDFDAAADMTQEYTPNDIVALCRATMQIVIRQHKRNLKFLSPDKTNTLRSVSVRDLREGMMTVFPTSWVASAYGALDSQRATGFRTWHSNNNGEKSPPHFHPKLDGDDESDE